MLQEPRAETDTPLTSGEILLSITFSSCAVADSVSWVHQATESPDYSDLLLDLCSVSSTAPFANSLLVADVICGEVQHTSRPVRTGTWNETFHFDLQTLTTADSLLRLFFRSPNATDYMGQAYLDLPSNSCPFGVARLPVVACRRTGLPPATAAATLDAFAGVPLGEVAVRWERRANRAAQGRRAERLKWCRVVLLEVIRAEVQIDEAVPTGGVYIALRCGDVRSTTQLCKGTQDPWWKETFEFTVDGDRCRDTTHHHEHGETPPGGIAVEVYARHSDGTEAFLGEAILDALGEEGDGSRPAHWVTLHQRRFDCSLGSVPVQIGRIYTSWRCLTEQAAREGKNRRQKAASYHALKVWLVATRRLHPDPGRKCVVHVSFGKEQSGTATVPATGSAENAGLAAWEWELRDLSDTVQFKLSTEDGLPLGEADLDPHARSDTNGTEWLPLRRATGVVPRLEDLGDIHVRWQYQLLPVFLHHNVRNAQLTKLLRGVSQR